MSRGPIADGAGVQHAIKMEYIVRLEMERKETKARLRLSDTILSTLEDQLRCVAQFKHQWLQHRASLESVRQSMMQDEQDQRVHVMEDSVQALNKLIQKYHPNAIRNKKVRP